MIHSSVPYLCSNKLSCIISAEELLFVTQEDGLTEDYTSSPLHRFKVQNIFSCTVPDCTKVTFG